ncbi:MAG: hypothetical protein CSA62_04395 [Planctomycetota bacterium]|nr:MAG: hypothetical protein CSA62_04395 [Planctomycetota bacterium]
MKAVLNEIDSEPYLSALEQAMPRLAAGDCCLGGRELRLFGVAELADAQLGFSVGPQGHPLWGEAPGDWLRSWLVIGEDDEHGDPIFIDLAQEPLPVYTAIVGEGTWEPVAIATSFESFVQIFECWAQMAVGRATREELEECPLSLAESEELLGELRRRDPGLDPRYWQDWLEGVSD